MLALRLFHRVLGVLSTLILVRLLTPGDFGLVAMATAVWALLELMSTFSFDVALIRDEKATREHYDTVWTITLIFGVFIALGLCALAIPASIFYSEPRLTGIMYAFAIASVIGAAANVGVVNFRKELDFRRDFNFLMAKRLVAFVITVSLAVVLQNYWAMVWGTVAAVIAGTILSFLVHPYRPRLSLTRARELFSFSRWLFLNNMFLYLSSRSTDLILGRMFGAPSLGIYNISNEIATLPTTELVAPINRAVFPVYAKLTTRGDALRHEFLRVFSMVLLISLPAAAGLAVTSEMIVHVALGPRWSEAKPLIQVLAFSGMLSAVTSNNGMIFLALGHPRLPALLQGYSLIFMIPGIIFGAHWAGVMGAALAVLLTVLLITPVSFMMVMRLLNVGSAELMRCSWRPAIATATMAAAVTALFGAGESSVSDAAILLAAVAVGASVYVACIVILWLISGAPAGAERYLYEIARTGVLNRLRKNKTSAVVRD